jgi:23S rRNA (uridine2552-2'-O)-methyltransferase
VRAEDYRRDAFAKRAKTQGYRSRAAYKLHELCARDRLIVSGARVIDLGASPGGWSQVARQLAGSSGKVIATDIVPMEPIAGVEFVRGDFREIEVRNAIIDRLEGSRADLVMSDMAPNISGVRDIDQARSNELVEIAIEFAISVLKPGGDLLVKAFQGTDLETLRKDLQRHFRTVTQRKPAASRAQSNELYWVARIATSR